MGSRESADHWDRLLRVPSSALFPQAIVGPRLFMSTFMSRGKAKEVLQVVWSAALSEESRALGSWRGEGSLLYT